MDRTSNENIIAKIEESLSVLAVSYGDEIISQIKPILMHNLAHHRVEGFSEGDLSRIDSYVQIVIEKYMSLHNYLFALQVQRDSLAWTQLSKKLNKFAYQFFMHKNFESSAHTYQLAEECAIDAAGSILAAQFPYDIDFDRWARRIIQNHCLRFMRDETRKKEVPADKIVELNEETDYINNSDLVQPLLEKELIDSMDRAIEGLSESRQEIIRWRYFEELSPAEIAERTGKSLNAVYGLQFNALRELRKIILQTGITLNG